jgi:hypothetical protein
MCHADQKLHEHVQKGSKEGFWPVEGEALVGGSYVLVREDVIVRVNLNDVETQGKSTVSPMSIIVLVARTHKKAGIGLSLPMAVYSLLRRSVIWS